MDLAKSGRILYVSMADVTQPNGPGVNEREFLISLYERFGDRMHALVPRPASPCDEIDLSRTTLYRNPNRWNIAGFCLQQLELYRRVRRLISRGRFDLIVVRLSLLPVAFYLLRHEPVPYAIKTLGEVQGFTQNRGFKGRIARNLGPINAFLFRQVVAHAVAVDCCTETHFREHLRDYPLSSDRLLTVENATNVGRFFPLPQDAAKASLSLSQFYPILGYVGGSPSERGGLQMLDVASRLTGDWPNLGVVIVGKDPSGILKRRASELGLKDRAVIPGSVPYEKIPTYVNCFDLGFALDRPTRWQLTGNSYQKVRQYLACGKPALTCIDPDSELVQAGLVQPVSPDDLTVLEDAVRRILGRDPVAKEQFVAKATRFAREKLSTKSTLDRRLGFWDQRLAERMGGGELCVQKHAA